MPSMSKARIVFSLSALLILTSLSCNREKIVSPEWTIYGSWVRLITDTQGTQFNAELRINKNNSYDFLLLDEAPGHTNSSAEFELDGDIITITDDADCDVEGIYECVISESKLALIALDDACTPRMLAIQGVWHEK